MKNVYFVICDAKNGNPTWDTFSGAFVDLNSAIDAAETEWRYFTKREQAERIVTVCHAEVDDDVALEDAFEAMWERGEGYSVDKEFCAKD